MEIIGKIIGMNTSDGLLNLLVTNTVKTQYNLKISLSEEPHLHLGDILVFDVVQHQRERISYHIESYRPVETLGLSSADEVFREFLPASPLSLTEAKAIVEAKVEAIENKTIQTITKELLHQYEYGFYIFPAAMRMHHNYVGGLAYHCISMLNLAEGLLKNYTYLNADYLISGILLHDIGKIIELSGPVNSEFTLDGQLLGHLVIGTLELEKAALRLHLENTEEVRLLKHLLISHHGQPQFGAAKKPMTPEALALWFLDTIDSKFRVLGEELDKTDPKTFTENIAVLDRARIYKI